MTGSSFQVWSCTRLAMSVIATFRLGGARRMAMYLLQLATGAPDGSPQPFAPGDFPNKLRGCRVGEADPGLDPGGCVATGHQRRANLGAWARLGFARSTTQKQ